MVRQYTPDCLYDDPFEYADDRYKMSGHWSVLPRLFREKYECGMAGLCAVMRRLFGFGMSR